MLIIKFVRDFLRVVQEENSEFSELNFGRKESDEVYNYYHGPTFSAQVTMEVEEATDKSDLATPQFSVNVFTFLSVLNE